MDKMYIVREMFGNFSHEVFRSEYWYEVEEYLENRWIEYCAVNVNDGVNNDAVDIDDESERELFFSYFGIEEKIITPAPAPSIYVDIDTFGEIVGIEKRENVR